MIQLQIQYRTLFGESVFVVGNTEQLGQWNVLKALRMHWSSNDIWTIDVIPEDFEYKYFIGPYDQTGVTEWEKGPNRHFYPSSSYRVKDIWNHRKIKFICQNTHDYQIYISGSCNQLGSFEKRTLMKNLNCQSILKIIIDIQEDQEIYYQFILISKKEYISSILKLNISSQQNTYRKSTLVFFYDGINKMKQVIYQYDPNICYGYVPKETSYFKKLQNAALSTIVEFSLDQDSLTHLSQKEGLNYMTVNLSQFRDNLYQRLYNLIQVLITKYKTIYICNNSLSHLRKYLSIYARLNTKIF